LGSSPGRDPLHAGRSLGSSSAPRSAGSGEDPSQIPGGSQWDPRWIPAVSQALVQLRFGLGEGSASSGHPPAELLSGIPAGSQPSFALSAQDLPWGGIRSVLGGQRPLAAARGAPGGVPAAAQPFGSFQGSAWGGIRWVGARSLPWQGRSPLDLSPGPSAVREGSTRSPDLGQIPQEGLLPASRGVPAGPQSLGGDHLGPVWSGIRSACSCQIPTDLLQVGSALGAAASEPPCGRVSGLLWRSWLDPCWDPLGIHPRGTQPAGPEVPIQLP